MFTKICDADVFSAGFTGNGHTCTDINECMDNTAGCNQNAECTNTAGSYTCKCLPGYDGDGKACQDIDECKDSVCDVNAECTNSIGSVSCSCNTGYIGDGYSCQGSDMFLLLLLHLYEQFLRRKYMC